MSPTGGETDASLAASGGRGDADSHGLGSESPPPEMSDNEEDEGNPGGLAY